jgi:hypothetical protein
VSLSRLYHNHETIDLVSEMLCYPACRAGLKRASLDAVAIAVAAAVCTKLDPLACFDLRTARPITRRPLRSFCPPQHLARSSLSHLLARLSNHTCEDSVYIQEHPSSHTRCAQERICILRHAKLGAYAGLMMRNHSTTYHESAWSEELSGKTLVLNEY